MTNPEFYKGDRVKCLVGNFKGLQGVIHSVENGIAKFKPLIADQKLPKNEYWDEKVENLVKIFKKGQHVYVTVGKYKNTTGSILDYNIRTIFLYLFFIVHRHKRETPNRLK